VTAAPSEGQLVARRYELEAVIGEGGMARVWRAHDLTLARPVAVKFLFLREDRERRTLLDRFLREARIAASVRHPSVVDILDFGTTEDGRPFMVMELLEGTSLEQRLTRAPALTLEELVSITAAILDGLAAVHRAGIVHRDLKPDNIFLLDQGDEVRPKLLDFGVSRASDPSSGRRSALTTGAGHLVGTPEYMSPEQARGLADVDHRTDLYSAGVVLYEALTGRLPYESEAVGDLIIQIAAGGAPRVEELRPEVGEAISAVIARAMSAKREDRFQSAREMRDALLDAAASSLGMDVRASLPAVVPMRRAAPSVEAPSSDARSSTARKRETPSTLDGELPWGASAVPMLGAASAPSSEPRSWTVDTTLPRASKPWAWMVAAVLIPLSGVGTWYALRDPAVASSTPIALAPPTRSVAEPPPEEDVPSIADPPAGEPEPPAAVQPIVPVQVRLLGLPPHARVSVDGAAVEADDDGRITLPRDGEEHEITVVAAGRRPWRATHTADADGEYRVRAGARRAPGEAASEPGGVFRDLDY